MSFKQRHVEKWTAEHFPGERFVSYTATAIVAIDYTATTVSLSTGSTDAGDKRRRALVDELGLDPELEVGRGNSTTFYAVTDHHLALGTRSSMRNRPQELIHATPLDGVAVHWFDHDAGAGNVFRHYVTRFGDGSWRSDKTGLRALGRPIGSSNADHFGEALGERAIEVADS